MKKIILDTNFLLTAIKFKIDIFSQLQEYDIYILDKTLKELENKKNEKLAKELIEKHNIKIIKTSNDKYVDDLLLEYKDFIIATQDKELKEKLKKAKISTISLRQKKYLIENVL
jgi:rRNA-processing protein FCF1